MIMNSIRTFSCFQESVFGIYSTKVTEIFKGQDILRHPTDSSLPISPIFLNEVQVIKNHNTSSKNIIAGENLPLDLVSVEATVDTSTVQDIDAFLGVYDTIA